MSESHPFLPNSDPETTAAMLKAIGLSSINELFRDVPPALVLKRPLRIPDAKSEWEVQRHVEELLERNTTYPRYPCFLGGGMWPHHVPAAVDEIIARSEFYTSYTPYQPEISQGMLQALFEYQSLVCDLTGMDVANSSMYDWPTAAGEAARMAVRVVKRKRIVASRDVGPERLDVLQAYCRPLGIAVHVADFNHRTGEIDLPRIQRELTSEVAAVYVENPNFFGVVQRPIIELAEIVHRNGSLLVVGIDPSSLGVLRPPGEYGADIVVGDGQPLGLHMNFGGPSLGLFATKERPDLLRQMPGRIIGMTTTKEGGQRGYTMVLQTREQHIRREAATSNICTNEALMAVAAAAYLALLGPEGLRELGGTILANSHYAAKLLNEVSGIKAPHFSAPFFKDFTVALRSRVTPSEVPRRLLRAGVLGGVPLSRYFPELKQLLLFSATEIHTPEDIQTLAEALRRLVEGS